MPQFIKDLKARKRPVNARSETAASSGNFRGALAARRCLVPADALYEWEAMADGKQPYAISRHDAAPIAFAGLWQGWRDPAGDTNDDIAAIHNRMPVTLEMADWATWLGKDGRGSPGAYAPGGDRRDAAVVGQEGGV